MHNDDKNILQILDQSACLSKSQLLGYLKHSLYPEELRTVELHLSSCLLCTEALEGMEAVQNAESLIASILPPVLPAIILPEKAIEKKEVKPKVEPLHVPSPRNQRIKNEVAEKANERNKFNSNPKGFWFKSIGVAAALLIGFGLIWYFELGSNKTQENTITANDLNRDSATNTNNALNEPQIAANITDSVKLLADKKAKDSLYFAITKTEKLKALKDTNLVVVNRADSTTANTPNTLLAANEAAQSNDAEDATINARKQTTTAAPVAAKAPVKEAESKTVKSDFELGMQQYKQNNFASALLYFKTAESNDKDPKHWEAVYLSGLCNKSLDKKRKAIKYFERVVEAKAPQAKAAQKQLDDLNKVD